MCWNIQEEVLRNMKERDDRERNEQDLKGKRVL